MTTKLGDEGESLAIRYLEARGLKLVARGFQTRFGEVDSIFRHKDDYIFVEVKTRSQLDREYPAAEAVTRAKQRRIVNAATSFIKKNRLEDFGARFDVVVIEGDHVEWIKNAFEAPSSYTL